MGCPEPNSYVIAIALESYFYLPPFSTPQRSRVANRFLSIKQLNVKPFLNYFFGRKRDL